VWRQGIISGLLGIPPESPKGCAGKNSPPSPEGVSPATFRPLKRDGTLQKRKPREGLRRGWGRGKASGEIDQRSDAVSLGALVEVAILSRPTRCPRHGCPYFWQASRSHGVAVEQAETR
jgi:hypothetical protein